MDTFYGKIDNKGDALTIGAEFLSLSKGAPPGGIGVAAPVPFFLCKYTTISLPGQETTCNFKTIVV
jgi:hypothetical protein